MAMTNAMDERKRAQEDEYFRKHEQQLIDKMRESAALQREREQLGEATGIADTELLAELQRGGFTPDTVRLIHLVPLVEMAWAEGNVSSRERQLILEAAAARGVTPEHPAWARLNDWLARRPSEEFFERALRLIRLMLQTLPAAERRTQTQDMVGYSVRVARASGGIGFINLGNKICDEEQRVLERLFAELEHKERAPAV